MNDITGFRFYYNEEGEQKVQTIFGSANVLQESFSYTGGIMPDDEITLGGCVIETCEFKLFNDGTVNITGDSTSLATGGPFILSISSVFQQSFVVSEIESYQQYVLVKCQGLMSLFNVDGKDWYSRNKGILIRPMGEVILSLCNYCGVTFINHNPNIMLQTYGLCYLDTTQDFTCLDVLRKVCEACLGFGVIVDGCFEIRSALDVTKEIDISNVTSAVKYKINNAGMDPDYDGLIEQTEYLGTTVTQISRYEVVGDDGVIAATGTAAGGIYYIQDNPVFFKESQSSIQTKINALEFPTIPSSYNDGEVSFRIGVNGITSAVMPYDALSIKVNVSSTYSVTYANMTVKINGIQNIIQTSSGPSSLNYQKSYYESSRNMQLLTENSNTLKSKMGETDISSVGTSVTDAIVNLNSNKVDKTSEFFSFSQGSGVINETYAVKSSSSYVQYKKFGKVVVVNLYDIQMTKNCVRDSVTSIIASGLPKAKYDSYATIVSNADNGSVTAKRIGIGAGNTNIVFWYATLVTATTGTMTGQLVYIAE